MNASFILRIKFIPAEQRHATAIRYSKDSINDGTSPLLNTVSKATATVAPIKANEISLSGRVGIFTSIAAKYRAIPLTEKLIKKYTSKYTVCISITSCILDRLKQF
jgi:hypothetical protein